MDRTSKSLLSVNILFLISAALIISLGSWMQTVSLGWGLIATEVLLILVPTLIYFRIQKIPLREGLRLRSPGWKVLLLSAVIAVGTWAVSILIGALSAAILGYTPPTPEGWLPATPLQAITLFIGLAIAAPFCEEPLWRGAIQQPFEKRLGLLGFIIPSLMFSFWHLRFAGLPALFPIALLLGFLAWRTQSIWPGIIVHIVYNGIQGCLITFQGLVPNAATDTTALATQGFVVLGIGCVGIPAAIIALILLLRMTKPAPAEPATADALPVESIQPPAKIKPLVWLPVAVFALIYIGFSAYEVIDAKYPEFLARGELSVQIQPSQQPVQWTYEHRNKKNDLFGETICKLTPSTTTTVLDCQSNTSAYEIQIGNSYYASSDSSVQQTYTWGNTPLHIQTGEVLYDFGEQGQRNVLLAQGTDTTRTDITINNEQSSETLSIPQNSLLENEWAWRLAGLTTFDSNWMGASTTFTWYSHWQEGLNASAPLSLPATVRLRGKETITTPAGTFETWHVELKVKGDSQVQSAWYTVATPHTLIKVDNGIDTLVLTAETPIQ